MSTDAGTVLLVVEDDLDLREALLEVLSTEGFTVAGARDGLEALNWLETHALPELVLLDMGMPRMTGWEFLERVLQTPALTKLRVVALTPLEVKHSAVISTLRKPFELDELVALVRRLTQPRAAGL